MWCPTASQRSGVANCKWLDGSTTNLALTDVPDSCYRRSGLRSTTPRRRVYGDQGEEVAWEVRQERFIEKRR